MSIPSAAHEWRSFNGDIFECDAPPSTEVTVTDAVVTVMAIADYLASEDEP